MKINTRLPELHSPLSENPENSYTLSSDYYIDPEIFELEKQAIFYRTWQYVAPVAQFKAIGDYTTLSLFDQNLFVIKGEDSQIRAFYNVCQHRAHELLTGSGNIKSSIVCPYHAWSYKKEGALIAAPLSQGRPDFNKSDFGLKSIRIEIFCNCVFINLDDNAQPLAQIAGDLESDLRARIDFIDELDTPVSDSLGETLIKANWKVVVDNYVECYHCNHAHRAFADLVKMTSYQQDTFQWWSRQVGQTIKHGNTAYNVDTTDGVQQPIFYYLWPNTTFNIMPGPKELNIAAIRPVSSGVSDFSGHALSVNGVVDKKRDAYVADVLVPEDIALCESVQRGLFSKGYSQGPVMADPARSGTGEHALHHFHRMVHAALSQFSESQD